MLSAKIAKKLSILYCQIADKTLHNFYSKYYGVKCDNGYSLSPDIYARIDLLEYYSQFSEEKLEELITTKACLKTLLNG